MDDDTDDDDDGWHHSHSHDLSSYSHGDFGRVSGDAMECSTRTVVYDDDDDDTEDDTSIQRNSNRNDRGSIVWLV